MDQDTFMQSGGGRRSGNCVSSLGAVT